MPSRKMSEQVSEHSPGPTQVRRRWAEASDSDQNLFKLGLLIQVRVHDLRVHCSDLSPLFRHGSPVPTRSPERRGKGDCWLTPSRQPGRAGGAQAATERPIMLPDLNYIIGVQVTYSVQDAPVRPPSPGRPIGEKRGSCQGLIHMHIRSVRASLHRFGIAVQDSKRDVFKGHNKKEFLGFRLNQKRATTRPATTPTRN
jgi:hypothetical protein